MLHPDTLYERPVADRHRLIFYLGHLEAFDWNLIGRNLLDLAPCHPSFDKLFAFGIDPEPGKGPMDTASDWPSVEEVHGYARRVRETLDSVLPNVPEQRVHVSIEHRLMHAETFAYLLHNLPYHLKPSCETPAWPATTYSQSFVEIPAGNATLGQSPVEFGWDNEFDRHSVDVPAFCIQKYKVTNGDYLRFVNDGASPPHFWVRDEGEWFYRGVFNLIPLPLDCPVYVTQAEATAYAGWAGKSLPTEVQFHRASSGVKPHKGNFDFRHWDPIPVTASPDGDSEFGVSQLIGNGWEWTCTRFAPFQGFRPFEFYPGYSADFFDNAHFILKGASPRTAACFLRPSFRNWFRPNYPYVYAGFRLVEN
jgi:formylglycine-generating enzyme required for sulfatase activity